MNETIELNGETIELTGLSRERIDMLILRLLVLQGLTRMEVKQAFGFKHQRRVNDGLRRAMAVVGLQGQPEDLADVVAAELRAKLLLQVLYSKPLSGPVVDDLVKVEKFLAGVLGYSSTPAPKGYIGPDGEVITQLVVREKGSMSDDYLEQYERGELDDRSGGVIGESEAAAIIAGGEGESE